MDQSNYLMTHKFSFVDRKTCQLNSIEKTPQEWIDLMAVLKKDWDKVAFYLDWDEEGEYKITMETSRSIEETDEEFENRTGHLQLELL